MDRLGPRRRWMVFAIVVALIFASGLVWSMVTKSPAAAPARAGVAPVAVVTARVESRDVPVRLRANGTVVALQSVDIRAQVTSMVRAVHFREGQSVRAGELLFSLDAAADEATLRKAQAEVTKDQIQLAAAQRNLARTRALFERTFVSQSALEQAQNQVDALQGQLAVDAAVLQAARVAVGHSEIRARFAGRTGAIGVRPGSLVQPGSPVLVTLVQTNPIQVSFALPEKELAGLRNAMLAGAVEVLAASAGAKSPLPGKVTFLDHTVDSATGTIRVKAEFDNNDSRLWPGMYVNVELAPRTIAQGAVVPVQAVQTSPERRFVYVVDKSGKVTPRQVKVEHMDEGIAVIEGVLPGARVVVEGAQHLRPGSMVVEGAGSGIGESNSAGKGKGAGPSGGGKQKTAAGKRA